MGCVMSENVELSAASSIFCRVMQLAVLATLGLLIYIAYSTEIDVVNAVRFYENTLTQDQRNLIIYSDFKMSLLKYLLMGFGLTVIVVLLGLFRVFGRCASRPFSAVKALRTVRFLGSMFILKALLDTLFRPSILYALTYDNPAGQRAFNLSIDDRQIIFGLVGIALITAANTLIAVLRSEDADEEFAEAPGA